MTSTPRFRACSMRPRIQPVPFLVRLDRAPLVECGGEHEVLIRYLIHCALERAAERGALAVAVGVEPDPVEPELEGDLEHVREALLRVGERLHPRRGVAVLLVPAPRGDEAVSGVADDLEQVGAVAEPAVVAERRPEPDALAAEVLADQLRRHAQLLAERHRRRLGKHRLGLRTLGAIAHVAKHDVAVGVLLEVEERRARERLDRVERVQQRAAAEKEGARRLELLVQAREQTDASARRVRVERSAVLRHVRADEPREPLADRGGLRVVADQQRRHSHNLLPCPPSHTSRFSRSST